MHRFSYTASSLRQAQNANLFRPIERSRKLSHSIVDAEFFFRRPLFQFSAQRHQKPKLSGASSVSVGKDAIALSSFSSRMPSAIASKQAFVVPCAHQAKRSFRCQFTPAVTSRRENNSIYVPCQSQRDYRRARSARIYPRRFAVRALASTAAISTLSGGVLVQFQTSSGAFRLAKVVKPEGKRNWIVEDMLGVTHSISTKQVKFVVGPAEGPAAADLEQLERICQQRAADNEELLQLVWEIVASGGGIDDSNVTDVRSVAEIVFSEDDPLTLYATHLLLSNDTVYFKIKNIKGKALYEARSESNLAAARLAEEAKRAQEAALVKRELAFLKSLEERSTKALQDVLLPRDLEHLIDCLKSMSMDLVRSSKIESTNDPAGGGAYQSLDARGKELVKEALTLMRKRVAPIAAMETLVAWGIYAAHENLALLYAQVPHTAEVPPEVMAAANDLISNVPRDIDEDRRKDLKHMKTYAIDSKETTEVDDAIGWDPDTNRVLVHVADPARFFPNGLDGPVMSEALRRVATLYLPEGKFTMFPEVLAKSVFSLDAMNSDGSALTFGFALADDGSLLKESSTIEMTKISAPLRYSYEEVDDILALPDSSTEHTDLKQMFKIAEKRCRWREMEGGALIVATPFSEVVVRNPKSNYPDVEISLVPTDTRSWKLVSELMITACTVSAEVAAAARIPVIYRGQEPFDYPDDKVLEAYPDGPVRAAVIFRQATPSQTGTEPMEHASLGLDAYMQVTSPIRRMTDLMAHFQLKAHLRGDEVPISETEMKSEMGRSNDVSRRLRTLENQTKKYWQLEFLRRLGPRVEHEGMYIRRLKENDNRIALVQFLKYGFQLVAQVPSVAKPGSRLKLKVLDAQPRLGSSRINAEMVFEESEREELSSILSELFSDVSSDEEP